MVSLPVYDESGSEVGSYEIDPTEIAPKINKQLLHDVVVMYLANRRQGSHRTRSRAEVAGSTKKMYRQKGTGNARAGTRKSGIRRGGGHIFAKRPRDYSYRLNKKAVRLATRMALAGKVEDEQVIVVDSLNFDAPQTSKMAKTLKALNLTDTSALLITQGYDPLVYKSARNIAGITVSPVADLNAYDVLRPKKLLVTKAALDEIKAGPQVSSAAAAEVGEA